MADGRTLAEKIASSPGTAMEPFQPEELFGLGFLLLFVIASLMLDYGLGRLIARLWRLVRRRLARQVPAPGDPEPKN
jgi:hypothetical protein